MPTTITTTTELYDSLTLEIERADSLTGLLIERLESLNERQDAPHELYALSVVAIAVSDLMQKIHDAARELHHQSRGAARELAATGGAR